ncbi:AAA family ATPase, partial [Streptomyces collinus]|uniref:AAA family ATPase n=1 Tax=Streptomyces collinus TaxID=42684 RepID=UPI00379AD5AA
MTAPDTPHASNPHPVPAGAGTVELFPVNFTAYCHHPPLKTEQNVRAIADLLAPYGLHLTPWETPPQERDRQAVEDRLNTWTGATTPSSRGNTVLYWVGHGSADSLAHHRTPAPIVGGVSAHDIAHAIGSRQLHPDAADSWAIVVIDACFSRRFAQTVHAELLTRYPNAGRYLLLSTAAEGYAELGDFTPALNRALTVTFRGQPAIGLATLGGQLSHDLGGYRGDTVDDHHDRLVRLLPDAATAVSASLDQLAEIQAVIDQLPADEQRHFLPKAASAELGELAWYFHGRTLERDRILHWLTTATHGALLVTGPAGSGKSALLGHILLHTRTDLREVLVRNGHLQPLPAGTPCPDNPFGLATHLSGLTLTRAVQLIAQAADLPDLAQQATDGRPPADLAARLVTQLRTRQAPLTLLFDALDEAEQPLTTAETLLRPLAALPTVRVIIGTRRSTHEGPDQPAPADTDILDALRPRPTPHGAGPEGGHEAWPDGHVQCVEVTRDPEALAGYLRAKLDAAKRRGALDADDTHIASAVRRLVTDHHHDGAEPQQFLYTRLAAHELLNDPGLITDPGPLIGRTHRQLFTRALERLHRINPAYTPLLRALGLAQGRGLPDQDGIWARAADALADALADPGSSIPGLLHDAAPYLVLDHEYGRSVYRPAHRTFTEHFTTAPDTPQAHAVLTAALTHHARHTLQTSQTDGGGTTTLPPPLVSPYIRHHLAAHARLGHAAGALDILADHPEVLDALDLTSITAAALNYSLPPNALPPGIAGTVLLQHEAQGSTAPDQPSGSATAWRRWWRRLGTTYIHGTPPPTETHTHNPGEWPPTLIAGSVQRRQLHLQLTGHTERVRAVAVFTAKDGSPRLATGSNDRTVRIWNPATGTQDGEPLTGHTSAILAMAVFTAEDGSPRLATGGDDGTVRIWNPATGTQDGEPLTGHTSAILAMAVFT